MLRYNKDEYYESHLDAFDPAQYGKLASQHAATVLTVLQAPEEGGETVFKKEGQGGEKREVADWRKCLEADYKYKCAHWGLRGAEAGGWKRAGRAWAGVDDVLSLWAHGRVGSRRSGAGAVL